MKNRRIGQALAAGGILLLFVLALALLRPPCPIRALTGLLCPGCGITRMLYALLRLDIPAAWAYHPAALLLLPLLLFLLVTLAVGYVRRPSFRPAWWQTALAWGMICILLLFGLLRNLLLM